MSIAIKPKYLVTFQDSDPKIITNGTILIENGKIVEVGKKIKTKGYDIEEYPHHIVIPGLINTHSHVAMTLFRGFADDIPLQIWLNEHIWPMEAKLTPHDVEIGAKLAGIECLLSGTTTINSMYWHPQSEAKGFTEAGGRIMVGNPMLAHISSKGVDENLVKQIHGKYNDTVRVSLNPHAIYSVTPDQYQQAHQFKIQYNDSNKGPNLQLHTHVAEDKFEMSLLTKLGKEFGFDVPSNVKTPVQYLNKLKVLDKNVVAAHSIECNKRDLNILAKKGVGISTNTVSNMKLGHNLPRIKEMIQLNCTVGLGTDGPSSNNSLDLFNTMKTTAIVQKSTNNQPEILPAVKILEMATIGGAKVLGWDDIGSIQAGFKADMIVIDLKKPHLQPILNDNSLFSHLVYSANGSDVQHTMVNGQWVIKDRQTTKLDLEEFLEKFQDTCIQLMER